MYVESVVPRPRGTLRRVCGVVLGIFALICCLLGRPVSFVVKTVHLTLCGLALGVTLLTVCLVAEEWCFHLPQRYGGSVCRMLRVCVCHRAQVGVSALALLFMLRAEPLSGDDLLNVLISASCFLLLKTTAVLVPSPVEMSEVCEAGKMNVSHGLAWSFYLGYLKLVLPHLQKSVEKLKELNGAVLKGAGPTRLHILLPLNAAVSSRPEVDDPNVRFHAHLPPLEVDRAGVRGRVFKNSLYKVMDAQGKPHFCVLEYATPLLTLHQMSHESSAGFGEAQRRHQVLLFYRTLRDILESSLQCRNLYRLILLDDQRTHEPHYLSTEIVRHLQQQQKEEVCLAPTLDLALGAAGPMSSMPSLQISNTPRPLRCEPEENSEL
uniref:Stimulator of interferon genes protein n=1 Tax=Denticeps clupeoides TaxID=299321 RepID=A0AAY4DRW0_9TELE